MAHDQGQEQVRRRRQVRRAEPRRANVMVKPLPQRSARTWATLLHLSGLIGFFLSPLGVLLPLAIWGSLHRRDAEIDLEGRQVLNFQLSMLLYLLLGLVSLLLMPGVVIVVFVAAAELYCTIGAAIHAARGEAYAYPLSLHFIAVGPAAPKLHTA